MEKRKTSSLYGRHFSHALLKEQAWLQSEKLPQFLQFYARGDLLYTLESNSNHLIVGRRGTGKTHLFGAFSEKINSDLNNGKIAIAVSALDFTETPPDYLDESIEFARAKYSRLLLKAFLNIFAAEFVAVVDSFLSQKKFGKLMRERVESKALEILFEIDHGSMVYENIAYQKRVTTDVATKKEGGGGLSLGVSFKGGLPSLEASAGANKVHNDEESFTGELHAKAETKIYKVRELILEILELLEVGTLYILIDEWMELDKNLNLGIQPCFAQLIKRTFFNHKEFSVKIASVWHRTDLYDQLDLDKSKGLELGDDIELGVDLDTAFISDESEVVEFFTEMLFKRLHYSIPQLGDFKKGDAIDEQFIVELFGSMENFKTLIAVSHGIPRKFWHFFHKCAGQIKHNFEEYEIDKKIICAAAQHTYLLEKRKNLEEGSASQALWHKINEYMETTGNRHFVVCNHDVKNSPLLRKLIDEELIHQVPSALTPRKIRDTHKAFMIDYGNYIDWLYSREKSIEESLDAEITPHFYRGASCRLENYMDLETALYLSYVICPAPSCGKRIEKNHPILKKFQSCPYCAVSLAEKEDHEVSGETEANVS